MKLLRSLFAVTAAFGAGYLVHRALTENEEEGTVTDEAQACETAEDAATDEESVQAEEAQAPLKEEICEDPKFSAAVALVVETQTVSTSLLQRRLGIGYGRAAEIIERMEALGYVGAPEGNKPRRVLITEVACEATE